MKLLLALSLIVILGACSNTDNQKDIGSGRDDYKKSPCACGPEIPQKWS